MTEFARALVLPDLGPPQREDVLSLLLVWDGLEVEITQAGKDDGDDLAWADQLEEAGALHVTSRPFYPDHPPESRKPFARSGRSWPKFSMSSAPSSSPRIR